MNKRFSTLRLDIKDMTFFDCDYAAKEWGDKEAGKYLADMPYKNGDELREILREELSCPESWKDDFYFSVFKKDTNIIIGTACVFTEKNKGKDIWGIGYTIAKTEWKKGYATELISGLIDFIKLQGGKIVTSLVAKDNIGSLKACYKNGMKKFIKTCFKKKCTSIEYEAYELRKNI